MEPEIVPEPAPEERRALLEALAELDRATGEARASVCPWRRSGFADSEDEALD